MKQQRNSIMRGASGALGDELVFRQRAGKTVISLPAVPVPDNPTSKQLGVRTKFLEAIRYAKTIMATPSLKESYAQKASAGVSAFNLALADFFKAPEITSVDLAGYTGAIGDTIVILAIDNFKVQTVFVSILNEAGDVLEEGAAIVDPENAEKWIYTATTQNGALDGTTLKVRASDLPGNITEQEEVI